MGSAFAPVPAYPMGRDGGFYFQGKINAAIKTHMTTPIPMPIVIPNAFKKYSISKPQDIVDGDVGEVGVIVDQSDECACGEQ